MADKNNPYIDETLMNAYVSYSPAENNKYLKDHAASKKTQQIAATNTASLSTQKSKQPQNAAQLRENSLLPQLPQQQPQAQQLLEQEVTGIPIGGNPDALPLSYSELCHDIKAGDVLYLLGEIEDEEQGTDDFDQASWSRVTFVRLEEGGFLLKDSQGEELFYQAFDDDNMPVMYKHIDHKSPQKKQNGKKQLIETNYIIPNFDYNQKGAKIFVYDDANNFVFYSIESFDSKTTKALLRDNSGNMISLCLKSYKHENADSKSKAIVIKNDNNESKEEAESNVIDMDSIQGAWTWISRTNSMKLKWISYKNTLLGTLCVATKHLYPISLDYKTCNFISGIGLGFNWLNIECNDTIDEHMKLFLCDSQLDATLQQIGVYSYYKFERHALSEIINDEQNGIQRLLELEQLVVKGLNENVCSITNDEYGHLALIVGYIAKPSSNGRRTLYYFKLKKFGVFSATLSKEENEKSEYVAIDLHDQRIVITMTPPAKEKKYSLQHSFNPKMLLRIVSDLISSYGTKANESQNMDLFGKSALIQMQREMERAKQTENVSPKLAKLTVFALIRLFDSRKTSCEYIDYIRAKIKNAYHSQSGSEAEWKFTKEYDISDNLKSIESSLKAETASIRRQQKLFEKYIRNYDGKPLQNIEWQTYDRAGIKAALDEIINEEDKIFDNLKKMKQKLQEYQISLSE